MVGHHNCEDIICTYCYEKFSPKNVKMHYRLKHALPEGEKNENKTIQDDIEAEFSMIRNTKKHNAQSGQALDDLMYKFYTERMGLSEQEAKTRSMQNEYVVFDTEDEFEYNVDDYKRYGFCESVKYKGVEADRICPFCHNPLLSGAGKKKMVLISVIGNTNAGKTVYFSSLQKFIANRLMYIGESDAGDYNFFEVGTMLPKATNLKPLPSCSMLYTLKKPTGGDSEGIILVFCDIAGENTKDKRKLEKTAFNLPNSSGILFMIDPTRFAEIARINGESNVKCDDQKEVFTALFNFFHAGENKLDIPTAIVITKSDILQKHPFFRTNEEYAEYVQPKGINEHKKYVKIDLLDKIDAITKKFLEDINESVYINNVEMLFNKRRFFMVSSIGYDPETEGKDGAIMPNRVTEPFEWLMFENDAAYTNFNREVEYEVEVPKLLGLIKAKEKRSANLNFYYKKSENLDARIKEEINRLPEK